MVFDLKNESYGIKSELEFRKILEQNTPHDITFEKNKGKYDFDLIMYKYTTGNKKEFICYVELEDAGRSWDTFEFPPHWNCYSFLSRKVLDKNKLTKDKNPNKIFYIRYNKDMNNCFCTTIGNIQCYGADSERNYKNNQLRPENDKYIELPVGSQYVVVGIENTVNYILGNTIEILGKTEGQIIEELRQESNREFIKAQSKESLFVQPEVETGVSNDFPTIKENKINKQVHQKNF